MLIRVRSKDGAFRFELPGTAQFSELLNKIYETTVNADPSSLTVSENPRQGAHSIDTLKGRTLDNLGLKHGTMLFLEYKTLDDAVAGEDAAPAPQNGTVPSSSTSTSTTRIWETVQEDAVDAYWRKEDGLVKRPRDATFCRHGPNSMCDHCLPLDPYDAKYHTEHSIKHLSYHAYLRKLSPKSAGKTAASTTSSASLPPLNPLDYSVKNPCPHGHHPAWPAGICTGCQPSAITLQSQPFRMVDHLEIAGTDVIDRFLHAWRQTGAQRFGWLIGHYEPYPEVPMGIKAVVEAIHEPPQHGELDGLSLGLPWEDEERIGALGGAAATPLSIVGYIFTDLTPEADDKTRTACKRHANSFFLSSLEVLFAGRLQRMHPATSRSSPTGVFSSRLVTAVLTGTPEGGIDVSAYQVSEQAEAMIAADLIEPSVEPGIVRLKEEDRSEGGAARYVPDVFFRYKNEYGLEVQKSAKPAFPVEYLLVNVTHGFPQNPSPLFRATAFDIENRPGLEDQSIEKVMRALSAVRAPDLAVSAQSNGDDIERRLELARSLSDWHLVAFLGTTGLFSIDDMKVLMRTVTSADLDDPMVLDDLFRTDGWQTLMTFTRESAPSLPSGPAPASRGGSDDIPQEVLDQIAAAEAAQRGASGSGAGGSAGGVRICPHCTFENTHAGSDCEVCGLPLG